MYRKYQENTESNYDKSFEILQQKRYYGLTKSINLEGIVLDVCDVLGYGSNKTAHLLILETIGAETNRGTTQDITIGAGMGLCQFDKLPFKDVQDRTSISTKAKVYQGIGISIDLVQWEDLRYNPLLSILFCRLKYLLVKDSIPTTQKDRSAYWKKWYNSILGKGTIEHYLHANVKYLGSDNRLA